MVGGTTYGVAGPNAGDADAWVAKLRPCRVPRAPSPLDGNGPVPGCLLDRGRSGLQFA